MTDDKLLIDFSADTYWHFVKNDIKMDQIRACIITHSHEDHLYAEDFCNRRQGFAYLDDASTPYMTVYGTEKPCRMVEKATSGCAADRIHVQVLERFKTANIDGYDVTPMDADHDPHADSVIYIIERGGKAMLRRLSKHPKCVAIGEIGLDYYYEEPERDAQLIAFEGQLNLAKSLNKPVIIHSRDAAKDTIDLLKKTDIGQCGGIMHCFS